MSLAEQLAELDRGFWTEGEQYFLDHVDEECVLIFEEKEGVFPRAEVAATARDPDRWKELEVAGAMVQQPTEDIALLGYEARVKREDGSPYHVLVGSGYVKRRDGWKLAFHQHSAVE